MVNKLALGEGRHRRTASNKLPRTKQVFFLSLGFLEETRSNIGVLR
jgi:hypothetical protein